MRRLSRGLYDYPKKHSLLGNLFPPLDEVAKTIAKNSHSTLQISGAQALYLLGLTTQVPAQIIYLTDDLSKEIKIANTILSLRHANSKIMAGAGSKSGVLLQAVRYLGKNNLTPNIIKRISQQLTCNDKTELNKIARYDSGWAKRDIQQLICLNNPSSKIFLNLIRMTRLKFSYKQLI